MKPSLWFVVMYRYSAFGGHLKAAMSVLDMPFLACWLTNGISVLTLNLDSYKWILLIIISVMSL